MLADRANHQSLYTEAFRGISYSDFAPSLSHMYATAVLFHPGMPNKERIAIKRGFQRCIDPLASTNQLKYPKHDHDAIASTFRLMGTDVTLTQADKCILMEP